MNENLYFYKNKLRISNWHIHKKYSKCNNLNDKNNNMIDAIKFSDAIFKKSSRIRLYKDDTKKLHTLTNCKTKISEKRLVHKKIIFTFH